MRLKARDGRTDFESCGLSSGCQPIHKRLILLTVDFEAFRSETMPIWIEAMHRWANHATRTGLRFSFFLSVEDAIRLRAAAPSIYEDFLSAIRDLERTGSRFYPHNHFVYETTTGEKTVHSRETGKPPVHYAKRKSLFWDVVHRHRLPLGAWLATVRTTYETILADAHCAVPTPVVFRAGGWDYGGSCHDLQLYVEALGAARLFVDSSACRGTFGTPTWRVGAEFGKNVFRLQDNILEVAPTWSVDVSTPPLSLEQLRTLLSLGIHQGLLAGRSGVEVAVLHFDHLFRRWSGGAVGASDVDDPRTVDTRIRRAFRLFTALCSVFRYRCATYEDVT